MDQLRLLFCYRSCQLPSFQSNHMLIPEIHVRSTLHVERGSLVPIPIPGVVVLLSWCKFAVMYAAALLGLCVLAGLAHMWRCITGYLLSVFDLLISAHRGWERGGVWVVRTCTWPARERESLWAGFSSFDSLSISLILFLFQRNDAWRYSVCALRPFWMPLSSTKWSSTFRQRTPLPW